MVKIPSNFKDGILYINFSGECSTSQFDADGSVSQFCSKFCKSQVAHRSMTAFYKYFMSDISVCHPLD